MTQILYGKPLADAIVKQLKREVEDLARRRIVPHLAVVVVGTNPASLTYINLKKRQAEEIGIKVTLKTLPEVVTQDQLIALIRSINQDPAIHGILVQVPMPKHINHEKLVWVINPKKDVDGFQMRNFMPPAPMAIIELLKYYGIAVTRKKVAIIGQGFLIGRPLSILLRRFGARVTEFDQQNRLIGQRTHEADIIVSATGRAHVISRQLVKPDHIVVDAGGEWTVDDSPRSTGHKQKLSTVDRGPSSKFVGEVVTEEVEPIVKALVPNPGGIGPVTVALLLRNVVLAAKRAS